MKRVVLVIMFALFGFPCMLMAQKQKEHPKGSYIDSLNRYYQAVDLPVYVFVSTSPNGKPTQLQEASDATKPMYLDGPGIHNLRHIDAINQRAHNFQIYADGAAPKTVVSFTGSPAYQLNNKTFFGKGLSIQVKATDDMSGVQSTYYSLNGADYTACNSIVPVNKEGDYRLKFYSVDNVGNVEDSQDRQFSMDMTSPKTYYEIVGISQEKVISLASLFSLIAVDSVSGISATYYSFDGEAAKRYIGGAIPLNELSNGEHTLNYYSIDNVANKEAPESFTFLMDRTAPIMSADILGDRFIVEDKVYFSGKTRVKLTAIDNISGLRIIKYSINDGPFETYTEPFYLPNKSGKYLIRYYAIDKMDNSTKEDKITHTSGVVYVDLTGPIINNSFMGSTFTIGDVIYVSNNVGYKFSAVDYESGVQRIAYALDGGEEKPYSNASLNIPSGAHAIEVIAYDNVNNRNIKSFNIFVDDEGPEIGYSFSTKPALNNNGVDVYPSYVTLYLNATDEATTVSSVSYTINDGKEQVYASPIKGFEKGKVYNIVIKAKDVLGNETTERLVFETNNL